MAWADYPFVGTLDLVIPVGVSASVWNALDLENAKVYIIGPNSDLNMHRVFTYDLSGTYLGEITIALAYSKNFTTGARIVGLEVLENGNFLIVYTQFGIVTGGQTEFREYSSGDGSLVATHATVSPMRAHGLVETDTSYLLPTFIDYSDTTWTVRVFDKTTYIEDTVSTPITMAIESGDEAAILRSGLALGDDGNYYATTDLAAVVAWDSDFVRTPGLGGILNLENANPRGMSFEGGQFAVFDRDDSSLYQYGTYTAPTMEPEVPVEPGNGNGEPPVVIPEVPTTVSVTQAEANEIRYLVHAGLSSADLSDEQISFTTFHGAAVDYVIGELYEVYSPVADEEGVVPDTPTERPSADEFIALLSPVQLAQFRRAILYRTAGLIAPSVPQLLAESAGTVSQRFQNVQWELKQASLFLRADEEIARVRNAASVDEFEDTEAQSMLLTSNLFRIV